MLQVRARVREDIERHFPAAMINAVDGADYRYRARVSKESVALRIADMILNDITYDSHFKDVAIAKDKKTTGRHSAYYGVWAALAKLQDFAPYSRVNRADAASHVHTYRARVQDYGGVANTSKHADEVWWSMYAGSRVDASEYEREPDDWELDKDTPDEIYDANGELIGWLDDRPARADLDDDELDAVEEAFGVEPSTLNEETLMTFVDELRQMKYVEHQPKRGRGRKRRRARRARI